ncbi:hypothetical protein Barb6_02795 [Bacteroidales bacterium Barb6]|nr:hypothetical protein Barb6_02795 [Bacteroidales bacterium Barb6]
MPVIPQLNRNSGIFNFRGIAETAPVDFLPYNERDGIQVLKLSLSFRAFTRKTTGATALLFLSSPILLPTSFDMS